MALDRAACVCACILIVSAAAPAQQGGGTTTGPIPQSPAGRIVETTYSGGSLAPARRVLTRSVSGDREVVVERFEAPGLDGRLEPSLEMVTETTRPALDRVLTTRDLFVFGSGRERKLVERTDSIEIFSGARTATTRNTWVPGRRSAVFGVPVHREDDDARA